MRPLWIGTSWKMNFTIGESVAYIDHLTGVQFPDSVQPFLLPALTALGAVRAALPTSSRVLLGAQNAHWADEGAATGEVSMRMAQDAGADLLEIGHSERREQFGETDRTVTRKVAAAVRQDLTPLLCVGEPADVRDSGRAVQHVLDQVRSALAPLSPAERATCLVAYEPVWAIGVAGRAARPEEVAPVMAAIAAELDPPAQCRAVLYGGSVHAGNAAGLLAVPHTDGLFVGRAAWSAAGFLELVEIVTRVAAQSA